MLEFMLEYDFIIVEDPKPMANKPQIGARIVIPGRMKRKGKPKVQTFFLGLPIWTRKIRVSRMSNEKASE
jgi:hypothetical protein